jgi:hypothetical protein
VKSDRYTGISEKLYNPEDGGSTDSTSMKIKAERYSETSLSFYQTTRHRSSEDTFSHCLSFKLLFLMCKEGRAIAQAVSRWLLTVAARVRAQVRPCGICGGQSGIVADFLRVLRFPLPIFIPPIAPQSPSPSGAGTIGQ